MLETVAGEETDDGRENDWTKEGTTSEFNVRGEEVACRAVGPLGA